jgi:hypothetical protein
LSFVKISAMTIIWYLKEEIILYSDFSHIFGFLSESWYSRSHCNFTGQLRVSWKFFNYNFLTIDILFQRWYKSQYQIFIVKIVKWTRYLPIILVNICELLGNCSREAVTNGCKRNLQVYHRKAWYYEIKKRCGKITLLRHVNTISRLVTTVTNIITFTAFIYVTEVTQGPTENNSEHTACITHFRSF